MLEMLICICIISMFTLITINSSNNFTTDNYYFLNNYLYSQSKAILNKENIDIGKGIHFNSMGHVNRAQTIDVSGHSVIIHLGNGYVTSK